jgi:N-acetylmuramoyl-L-alanine amidase
MTISLATPYRTIGDLPIGVWQRVLSPLSSPMLPTLADIVKASSPHGALGLTQSVKETTAGRDETAKQTFNPLGLMVRPGSTAPYIVTKDGYHLQKFGSWAAAAAEFSARLDASPYTEVHTLGEYIDLYLLGWFPDGPHVYPRGNTPEDRALYQSQTVERLNSYGAGGGTPVPEPSYTVPMRTAIIPKANHNRPGDPLLSNDLWITVHETANTAPTATAEMHRGFVWSGGGPETVSFHFVVDDFEVIQLLPLNELGWHAGDGCDEPAADDGCFRSVAIETCVNKDGPGWDKAFKNLCWLISELIRNPSRFQGGTGKRFSQAKIAPHSKWMRKDCPHRIHERGLWDPMLRQVAAFLNVAPQPAPKPQPSKLDAVKLPEGVTPAMLAARFGPLFDPNGEVTVIWAEEGSRTGRFAKLEHVDPPGPVRTFDFADGLLVISDSKGVRIARRAA